MRAAEKEVAWAGTMNGQAIAVHAAIATLEHLRENQSQVYGHLEDISTKLVDELNQTGLEEDVPLVATNIGSILQLYWKIDESSNKYENMRVNDFDALTHLAELLIHYGVHSRENGMWYVAAAHSVEDIEITSKAVRSALEVIKGTGGFR